MPANGLIGTGELCLLLPAASALAAAPPQLGDEASAHSISLVFRVLPQDAGGADGALFLADRLGTPKVVVGIAGAIEETTGAGEAAKHGGQMVTVALGFRDRAFEDLQAAFEIVARLLGVTLPRVTTGPIGQDAFEHLQAFEAGVGIA